MAESAAERSEARERAHVEPLVPEVPGGDRARDGAVLEVAHEAEKPHAGEAHQRDITPCGKGHVEVAEAGGHRQKLARRDQEEANEGAKEEDRRGEH